VLILVHFQEGEGYSVRTAVGLGPMGRSLPSLVRLAGQKHGQYRATVQGWLAATA